VIYVGMGAQDQADRVPPVVAPLRQAVDNGPAPAIGQRIDQNIPGSPLDEMRPAAQRGDGRDVVVACFHLA